MLSKQCVSVFNRAAFARVVRRREIAADMQRRFELSKGVKFSAVIERDRVHRPRLRATDGGNDAGGDSRDLARQPAAKVAVRAHAVVKQRS